jgi:hypothetical protein
LPVWEGNPESGIFAHVSWAAEDILKDGPRLPEGVGGHCPHEGLAFAVSIHPLAWAKIARIGTDAPVVVIQFKRPALDFYKWLGKRHLEGISEVTDWGVEHEWITRGTDLQIWHWGTEWGEKGQEVDVKRYWTIEKGDKEEAYYREQLALGDEADESVISIKEVPGWRYTEKLIARVTSHYARPNNTCLTAEVFNLWLAENHPEFGMIWYTETLDPANLSAPRGAILPPYFQEVKPLHLTTTQAWGEEEW